MLRNNHYINFCLNLKLKRKCKLRNGQLRQQTTVLITWYIFSSKLFENTSFRCRTFIYESLFFNFYNLSYAQSKVFLSFVKYTEKKIMTIDYQQNLSPLHESLVQRLPNIEVNFRVFNIHVLQLVLETPGILDGVVRMHGPSFTSAA